MKRVIEPIIFIFLFFILHSFCYSQNSKSDSLLEVLGKSSLDTSKVKILNDLFIEYEYTDDEKAREYLNKAFELSGKIGYKKGLATSYIYLGYFAQDKGNYQEAIDHFQSSLKISEKLSDKTGIAAAYNNIGSVHYSQGNYPEALRNFFASLKIRESLNDKKGIASCYNNIGIVYADQGNYSEALKNHLVSLKIEEEINDQWGVAATYNNLGIVYKELSNYPEAIKNHLASLKIKEEIGDKAGTASSYNNLGNVYTIQGNYPAALKNHLASLKIEEEIGNKAGIAFSYTNIGEVFLNQKKYKEAKEYLIKAKELSTEIGHKECLKYTYNDLTELYSAQGNFKEAYENHKLYILYRDSLDNEQTREKTIQNQMNYDFEKKAAVTYAEHKKELENQNALAEEKSRKQKVVLLFVIGSLLLALVFAAFIFRTLRLTRKQKLIIEEKNAIVEEKQKEILDSIHYAKRIQNALLKEEEHVSEHLPEHFILFKPKDIVSGDFYWAIEKQEYLYMAAVDCTGHGVPGAMMSMLGISFLNEITSSQQLFSPAEILDQLREKVVKELGSSGQAKDGMDISLCRFNLITKEVEWAGANNPLWMYKITDGKFKMDIIKGDKQPVGYNETYKPFTNHSFDQKDCIYYLFTDGFADQFGGSNGKKFMYHRLEDILIKNVHLKLEEQKEVLTKVFEEWKGDLEQIDDVTVIGIRI